MTPPSPAEPPGTANLPIGPDPGTANLPIGPLPPYPPKASNRKISSQAKRDSQSIILKSQISNLKSAISNSSFTLVEMLVAITISIVIVVLLAGIISQSMIISHKSASELQAENAAAAAVDLIIGDLSTVAATRQPYEYFQTFADPSTNIGPTTAMSVSPARLLMLSSAAEDASTSSTESGLIHGISYQIQYLDPLPNGTKPVFGLWRTVVAGSSTFNSSAAFPGTTLLGSTNQFTTFWSNSSIHSVSSLNTTPQTGIKTDFVAANVIDLETTCYQPLVSSSNGISIVSGSATAIPPTIFKGVVGGVQFIGTTTYNGVIYNSSGSEKVTPTLYSPYGYPAYVEVSVTVLEDEGATLWAISNNSGQLKKTILKQKYGHTLTRKIALPIPQ